MRASLRLAFLIAALLAGALGPTAALASSEPKLPILEGVGGDFAARSSLGREVSLGEFRGKVVLLFFGYTSCQDVCPVTLAHLKDLVKLLGPAADAVQVLFVTVDPEVDTVEVLAKYLPQFDARFIGLSGTREQINQIAGLYLAEHHRSHDVEISTEHHRSKPYAETSYLYTHAQQIPACRDGERRALPDRGAGFGRVRRSGFQERFGRGGVPRRPSTLTSRAGH